MLPVRGKAVVRNRRTSTRDDGVFELSHPLSEREFVEWVSASDKFPENNTEGVDIRFFSVWLTFHNLEKCKRKKFAIKKKMFLGGGKQL